MAALYSSCMFEPILSISMYVANMLRSTTSPFRIPYCWSCSVFASSADLSAFELILGNMEIAKVNQ